MNIGRCINLIGIKNQTFQPIYDEFNSELVVMEMSGDHTRGLKAHEELCRVYPVMIFEIRSDGGKEFDNKTPAKVRIVVTDDNPETSGKIEKLDTFF